MVRRILLLGSLALVAARAAEIPEVPAVRFDLLPGGRMNVVVGAKTFPMDSAKAAELRKTLDGLDMPGMRSDVSKLREALRTAEKAEAEAAAKAKSVERENGRVKSAEKEVSGLEKRRASLEEQIQRAQRNKADTLDGLRSQLAGVNQRLTKEKKDLARAKELQGNARKAKEGAESLAKASASEAERLRKAVETRLEKVRAALMAAGVA
jgi:DNA repair exonuclease SbcCD ATPase subunit